MSDRDLPLRLESLADEMADVAARARAVGQELLRAGEATAWASVAADSFRADLAGTAAATERTVSLVEALEGDLRAQAQEVREKFALIDAARAWVSEQAESARTLLRRAWDGVVDVLTGDVDRARQVLDVAGAARDELDPGWLDAARALRD
ncbi:hypothetical protein [Georgenia sp. SUBG003]|uniref:hypothetical protein n=1 Tax=Georgenia sp. SUBG003 TaxID=1497974 RepID=UPI0004D7F209|nr:hypothetical protein DA06_16215 [Georgenia sp. SUBG003]